MDAATWEPLRDLILANWPAATRAIAALSTPGCNGRDVEAFAALMRAAALRFWLSRLWDLHLPRDASLLTAHDPSHFERVLRQRVAVPWHPAPGPNLSPRPS